MTISFPKSRLCVGLAQDADDLAACQDLRHQCFFGKPGRDIEDIDKHCQHLMVHDALGQLVATARLLHLRTPSDFELSYAAQSYELDDFSRLDGSMIEIGRFCVSDQAMNADVLRIAWAALTKLVDQADVKYLFGAASFAGVQPQHYGRALRRLRTRHLGPDNYLPRPRDAEAIALADLPDYGSKPLPPLLRTYLAMNGWVGDHAVIDRQLDTCHVFTCVEIAKIPAARARALRALAQEVTLA